MAEVIGPIVAIVLTLTAVFVPVAFLAGHDRASSTGSSR